MDENDRLQEQVERFNRNNPDAPDHVAEVERLRAEIDRLTAERAALLAPVDGINEDLGVLANMACEDPKHNDLWCPTCEECPAIRALARETIHLRAELEEARLTLAAEQGRAEGAPSEGWIPDYQSGQFPCWQWRKTAPSGERVTVDYFPVERRWEWCFMDRPNYENFPWVRDRFRMTAREAMIVVDEAIKRSRRIPDSEVRSGPHK